MTNYWLMKSEPHVYSYDDLVKENTMREAFHSKFGEGNATFHQIILTPKKLDVAPVDHFRSTNHFSGELFPPLVDHFGANHFSPIILVGQNLLHSPIIT